MIESSAENFARAEQAHLGRLEVVEAVVVSQDKVALLPVLRLKARAAELVKEATEEQSKAKGDGEKWKKHTSGEGQHRVYANPNLAA